MKAIHKISALLTGAALLVVLAAGVSYRAFRQIEIAADEREHAKAVMSGADDLLSALKDAETGMRGYMLTGDEAFLEPYLAGI